MTREELLQHLRALSPEEAMSLIRELLDRTEPRDAQANAWAEAVETLLKEHRPAWERLANR